MTDLPIASQEVTLFDRVVSVLVSIAIGVDLALGTLQSLLV